MKKSKALLERIIKAMLATGAAALFSEVVRVSQEKATHSRSDDVNDRIDFDK